MAGKARDRILKAANEKRQPPKCPLISAGWASPLPGKVAPVIIGQQAITEQPMATGVAAVPCPENVSCAWWHGEAGQCAVMSMLDCLIDMTPDEKDDGDDDPKEGSDSPGGDDATKGRILTGVGHGKEEETKH